MTDTPQPELPDEPTDSGGDEENADPGVAPPAPAPDEPEGGEDAHPA